MRLAESSRTLVETLWLLLRRRELEATGRWKGDQVCDTGLFNPEQGHFHGSE